MTSIGEREKHLCERGSKASEIFGLVELGDPTADAPTVNIEGTHTWSKTLKAIP